MRRAALAAWIAGVLVAGCAHGPVATGTPTGDTDRLLNPDAQILEDLQLSRHQGGFRLIRLYDSGALSQRVLRLIEQHQLDLRVLLGSWLRAEISNHEGCSWLTEPIPPQVLAKNRRANARQVEHAIELARRHAQIVVAVNVGNEALVTWTKTGRETRASRSVRRSTGASGISNAVPRWGSEGSGEPGRNGRFHLIEERTKISLSIEQTNGGRARSERVWR